MKLLNISLKSLLNRKGTTFLTILSIALSVALLLGIERIRTGAKQSFESTVSGVDLIAGARSGPINLMLYSVFRIGNATNNVSYQTFKDISNRDDVSWSIPISLGDSHKGYKVVGTSLDYFKHFKFAGNKNLKFMTGNEFKGLYDVVLGADVASQLKYQIGDKIVLSHGSDKISFQDHADKPFTVVGVLSKTGTPVDQSLHVSLEAIEAIHIGWQQTPGDTHSGDMHNHDTANESTLTPKSITAFFLKLNSRLDVFNVKNDIDNYNQEAVMAVLPGVVLRDLWNTIGSAEKTLLAVSLLVFLVSLVSMIISLLATLNERRREMAIFRSLGAQKGFIFSVLIIETGLLTLLGILLGLLILYIALFSFKPVLESQMGLNVNLLTPSMNDFVYLSVIFASSLCVGILPSYKAYKNSLADGLTIKS